MDAIKMEALERSIPFNDRLIDEVRKFPSLYNNHRRTFLDSKERNKIWDVIAASINPAFTGEFAKRRWLQIRDRYRKELKVVLRQGFHLGNKWKYFHRLGWLDPFLKDLDTPVKVQMEVDGNDDGQFFPDSLRRKKMVRVVSAHGGTTYNGGDDDALPHSSSSPEALVEVHTIKRERDAREDSEGRQPEMGDASFPSPMSEHSAPHLQSEIMTGRMNNREDSNEDNSQMFTPFLPFDWTQDEDFLFGRYAAIRLKKMSSKKAKRMRARMLSMLDETDSEGDVIVEEKVEFDRLVPPQLIDSDPLQPPPSKIHRLSSHHGRVTVVAADHHDEADDQFLNIES